jgi:hypothetical protein
MVNDGDEIVFYCVDWQESIYSFFTPSTSIVSPGETFKLALRGMYFADGENPVQGAMIDIKSNNLAAILPMIAIFTDENGEAEIMLPSVGIYEITAYKQNDDGVTMISKPICTVYVAETDNKTFETDNSVTTIESVAITVLDETVAEFFVGSGKLIIFGKTLALDDAHLPFENGNGLFYFPVRVIAESLGAEVLWKAETSTAIINYAGFSFSFNINEPIDGLPVIVKDGISFIPFSSSFTKLLGIE